MPQTARRRRNVRRGKNNGTSHAHIGPMDPIFEISESVALLEQAVESNQHQIHEVSESTSRQISELATSTNRQMREMMTGIEKQGAEFRTEIRSLATEFANSKKTNWPLFLSVLGAVFIFLGAAYKIADLQTQVTMSPVVSRVEVGERERARIINDNMQLRDNMARLDTDKKVLHTKLAEVETQFHAADIIRNIQHVENLRWRSVMWEKTMGSRFPSELQYYPQISNRPNTPSNGH